LTTNSFAQRYEYGEPVPMKEAKKHKGGGSATVGKARFGVFLAPNFSWMKPTANKSDDKQYLVTGDGSKTGFMWGLMMDYFFSDNYALATGFQINYTGGKITSTINPAMPAPTTPNVVQTASLDYKIQYLEVPFALKLRSDDMNGVRVFGQIGINIGVPLSKKASYNITYTDTVGGASKTLAVNGENEKLRGLGISPVLLQMNLGGGLEYSITEKMSIYAGVFYNNGFIPDVTNPKDLDLGFKGNFSDGNIRLNNIAIRIGMFF
jgi:opacity protein-like surface antigen